MQIGMYVCMYVCMYVSLLTHDSTVKFWDLETFKMVSTSGLGSAKIKYSFLLYCLVWYGIALYSIS